MNHHTLFLWFVVSHDAWADISSPRPYFEQKQLPPPDLPPYLFPWSMMWSITPILLICALLFLRKIRSKESNQSNSVEPPSHQN